MYCPACADTTLTMAERHGIEIDYCPKCRGVWLDRGELDKIIERAAGAAPTAPPARPQADPRGYPPPPRDQHTPYRSRDDRDHGRYDDDRRDGHHRKRREGFLSDLFDFD